MNRQDSATFNRRRLLTLLGSSSALALAGCSDDTGGDGDGGPTATSTDTVPSEYETAAALNGRERDPGSLSSKEDVSYQPEPQDDKQCSGCAFYIPDKNGDGTGACAIVEGNIEPNAYCVSYAPFQGTDTPEAAQAVEVPEDAECAVCKMMPAKFPDWNAQAVHADDTRAFFCTSGCATTYYAVPDEFADTDADVAGLWVRDLDTTDLIDGIAASFALETDSDRLDDPMNLNPAPFQNREDAVAYVDEVDYLDESDILELSAFDRELAEQYRGKMLE